MHVLSWTELAVANSCPTNFDSLQDEMFQKFNFDTEWAVRLISRITNDEDIPIEGNAILKQVTVAIIFNFLNHSFHENKGFCY